MLYYLWNQLLENSEFAKRKNDIYNNITIFSPFPHRLAQRCLIGITPDDAGKKAKEFHDLANNVNTTGIKTNFEKLINEGFKFLKDEDIANADICLTMKDSVYTRHMFEYWCIGNETYDLHFESLEEINQESDRPFYAKIQNYSVKSLENAVLEKLGKKDIDEENKKSFLILHGLRLPQIRYLTSEEEPISSFLIPIASNQIFYGDLLVCVPHFKEEKDVRDLASKLDKCVKKHYVPALALIHENIFEKQVNRECKEVFTLDDFTNEEKPKVIQFLRGKREEDTYKNPICRQQDNNKTCYNCEYFGWEQSSDNVVEKYLHKLWQDRFTGRTYIKESLFFKNRLYTDPKMLDVLENFLKPSKAKLKKDEDKVPSVLVEAEAGAGKEDIPKLLKLFSDCYNRGPTHKLNMAAIKPDAVAPVAMVGGEVEVALGLNRETLSTSEEAHREEQCPYKLNKLKGIFKTIRTQTQQKFENFIKGIEDGNLSLVKRVNMYLEKLSSSIGIINSDTKKSQLVKRLRVELDLCNKLARNLNNVCNDVDKFKGKLKQLESGEKLIVKKLFGKFPTIVLDELNSMNIESQGVLLRFLEQAEITPIGGYEDKMEEKRIENSNGDEVEKAYREFITDFLVVGLMNEDPEEITREEAIRFLKKEKYVGGFLGDLLYEHVLKIRRLRPDLRARMMRNGKFKMPKLAEHRTDVPHNFYRFINDAIGDYFPKSEIRITLDALEYLLSEKWEWHENFRLLQALVNKVIEVVYEDYEKKTSILKIYDDKNLIIIRQKHIYKAMKGIGMEDEFRKEE